VAGFGDMDQQDKVNPPDLPEPAPRLLTTEQKLARRWRLFVVMLSFVAIYAVLHKLLLPSILSLTVLRESPYSKIDWWFIYPVVLTLFVQRSARSDPFISFLAGIGILYGIYEIYETMQGRNTGWLAFSRLLSSIPLAISCGYLMTQRGLGGSLLWAWAGVLSLTGWIGYRELSFLSSPKPPSLAMSSSTTRPRLLETHSRCGARELEVAPSDGEEVTQLRISDCGLIPSIISIAEGTLEIVNERAEAVTLHLVSSKGKRLKTDWNLSIPARSKMMSKRIRITPGTIAMLYSDSQTDVGITALRSPQQIDTWVLRRKPITLEKTP
jgi:hypothetical protein